MNKDIELLIGYGERISQLLQPRLDELDADDLNNYGPSTKQEWIEFNHKMFSIRQDWIELGQEMLGTIDSIAANLQAAIDTKAANDG